MNVVPYSKDHTSLWNEWIDRSKNGTFLIRRDFMDYHADRFKDASLLFYEGKKLVGVLPANVKAEHGIVESHGGLTYGALITDENTTGKSTIEMLSTALSYYKEQYSATQLLIKPTPYIYHRSPADEQLYAFFRFGAKMEARSLSSVVLLSKPLKLTYERRRGIKKAEAEKVEIRRVEASSDRVDALWDILDNVLRIRHGVKPVHSIAEVRLLASRFPKEILFFIAERNKAVVGGCVVFATNPVVHIQYIAANEEGRSVGALDLLFSELIRVYSEQGFLFLDFGISTENGGSLLNEGLLHQKEGFSGRGVCYDTYSIPI